MNILAEKLNETLGSTKVYSMLSSYGKRMYVPKGIIVQSAEAKQKATKYNATIGVALEHGTAMYIPGMKKQFADSMQVGEIFPYAPMGGVAALRQVWQDEMRRKNPDLKDKKISLPVVCSGLTNALSIVFSLFVDPADDVVLPNLYWENYDLIIDEQCEAKKVFFDFFDGESFNLKGFEKALQSIKGEKAVVLLNFPNNPTGYTPTNEESDAIAALLKKYADAGKKLVVVSDDAYFGLFYEKNTCTESLFAKLCDASENLLAVKCDGATKEEMVWGFRVAFITYGFKGCEDNTLDVLIQKTMGTIRGSLSNCSLSAQNILLKGMKDPDYLKDKKRGVEVIGERYSVLKKELAKFKNNDCLKALPFNSGYFMSFKTKCKAEDLRLLLLDKYSTGTIRVGEHLLRIAFSSVDVENVPGLVSTLYQAASELC